MNMEIMRRATDRIRRSFPSAKPVCGIILGSGLGSVADAFTRRAVVNYADIPDLGTPGIEGHSGTLVWAELGKTQLFLFCGRRHWYEGKGWDPVAIPIAILKASGAKHLLLTNAAGGVSREFAPGDLMLIEDHINCMGANPLIGTHDAFWGPRFPDLSGAYDPALRRLIESVAFKAGIQLRHGTYAAASGPTYETPAEVRAYRALGADAVGMSTVPEAILAHGAGLRVAGISCIVNGALDARQGAPITHDEVTAVAGQLAAKLTRIATGLVAELSDLDHKP